MTELISVNFKEKRNVYPVPRQVLKRFEVFSEYFEIYEDVSDVHMDIAEEDIGHTIIHWLYTGRYQTLPDPSLPSQGTARRELEYKRSVHVHCVASAYGLEELEWLAKQQIRLHEGCVDIYQNLAIAREVLPIFKGRMDLSGGYLAYLREKLMFAFKIDRNFFKRDEFFECLGQVPELNKFVLKSVIELHSSEISELNDSMRFAKIERVEDVDGSETVHEDKCSANRLVQNKIVWTEPGLHQELAPDYEASSTGSQTPSDSEESWSDLESLSSEIDCVD